MVKTEKMTGIERVYTFIVKFITENCYSPSIMEICEGAGVRSKLSVYDHLMELELIGYRDYRRDIPCGICQRLCHRPISFWGRRT